MVYSRHIRRDKRDLLVQLFGYFLGPLPVWWGFLQLKIYITFIISVFGPLARNFIFTSLVFHVISSVLMFILIRQMRLGARIDFWPPVSI